jgi:hypothetical protein
VLVLADFTLGDLLWSLLVIFLFVIWFYLLIVIFTDLFSRDMSGWAKAAWVIGIIIFPFLGILVYLIARPKPTDEEIAAAQREQMTSAGISTADQLTQLSALHDQGKISDEEFAKAKKDLLGS